MILFINTTGQDETELALITNMSVKKTKSKLKKEGNNSTAEALEKFLIKNKIFPFYKQDKKTEIKTLNKIIVCTGPGSFTGIRVGMALAQALSFTLNIPLNTIPLDKIPKNTKLLT